MTAWLLILLGSPEASATVGSLVVSDGLGLGVGDALGDGDPLGEALGLAEAEGDALPDDFALAWPAPFSSREPKACAVPPDCDPDGLGVGLAAAEWEAAGEELGDGDGLADGLDPGLGGGKGIGTPRANSSTWRNLSTAELSNGEIS